jgi:hypothetical protein
MSVTHTRAIVLTLTLPPGASSYKQGAETKEKKEQLTPQQEIAKEIGKIINE